MKSNVIQSQDYYPFGLAFNSFQRENGIKQKFKFQGQEHIDDLDLGWDSFKWRNHQPDIGRFFSIDPLAVKYVYNSPYSFSENHVVAHVEFEGLEKVSIQQSLNNNYRFYNAYNIQRKTSGGKAFARRVARQSKVNVFYFAFNSYEEGATIKIKTIEEFRKLKENDETFRGLNEKEVEMAMGDKELILVGVDTDLLEENDNGSDAAMALNHEEIAHGKDILNGNKRDVYGDHEYYYGYRTYYSPDNDDVMSKERYKGTTAKKQFDEIFEIIMKQLDEELKHGKNKDQ